MAYSLLKDSIISVRFKEGRKIEKIALPEVFEGLMQNKIVSFEALQPHQKQPWFSFLVQLGAMAVAREADGEIPIEASNWSDLLLGLSEENYYAWQLVVDDISQPAFMQPPVPEGSLEDAGYKADVRTPDELDMLVTSKNHDVKRTRILRPAIEHWLFALITLQTMEGIMGRGNYGIVRMNGGYGNRPFVGYTSDLSWSKHFKRDLKVLLEKRDKLLDMYKEGGHVLLWLSEWDGNKTSGIPINKCDPYFIEICRRIRFLREEDKIICYRTNTKAGRISASDDLHGQTNDPWTPIDKSELKALTVGESGFSYKLLQNLLLGDEYSAPIALEFQDDEEEGAYLVARTLVRGQGKTDGLHQRIVPVPSDVTRRLFKDPTEKEKLAKRAKQRVELAGHVQNNILRPAISPLLASGKEQRVSPDKIRPWLDRFDDSIDEHFFDSLWGSVDKPDEEARRMWEEILYREAQKQLEKAEQSIPMADIRRLKAISKARSIFGFRVRQELEMFNQPANTH